MDELVEKLGKRYGMVHDYASLTDQQRKLLLTHGVMNKTDVGGDHTVTLVGITLQNDIPVLEVTDFFGFAFWRNNPGGFRAYTRDRLDLYNRILNTSVSVNEEVRHHTYVFDLPGCRVLARYDAFKDRV